MPFFARWDSYDRFVQIRIKSDFLQQVASETLETKSNGLELLSEFKLRDAHLEAIAMMLLAELKQEQTNNRLYVDSLANVLAVHLLRDHATAKPNVPVYDGGLPQRQLMQVLDYIDAYLHRDIKLADLAALLNMSPFHFSRLFKQSLGVSPYKYLLKQRVERAKQLLKRSDRPITDIAFECGFNSHSHLSKQFRQLTGITPRVYRAN